MASGELRLDEFLERNLEHYLLNDIHTLKAARPRSKDDSACAYSLLMTVCRGVELLGALSSEGPFDLKAGRCYFVIYWSNYLYPASASSARARVGEAVYTLTRSGLAHAFLATGPLLVVKTMGGPHLTMTVEGELIVNSCQLADDFERSYQERFKRECMTKRGRVAHRLHQMWTQYVERAHASGTSSRMAAFDGLPVSPRPPLDTALWATCR